MRYLLDTCVLSELVKKHPDPRVVTWVDERESVGFLSVLTLGDLQKGVAKLVDGDRRAMLQDWIDVDLRARFVGRILPVNEHIASVWGGITRAAEQCGTPLVLLSCGKKTPVSVKQRREKSAPYQAILTTIPST